MNSRTYVLKRGMKFFRQKKANIVIIFEVLVLISICILHALSSGHYANFFPINGTFQNYNPVRRLLNGQIPYRDFYDYLGLGHLYAGSLFTKLLGGTYRDSLVAFSFLTFAGFASVSLIIGRAVFNNWKTSLVATNVLLILLLVKPLFFVNGVVSLPEISSALNFALDTGNSARFIRASVMSAVIAAFTAALKIYDKKRLLLTKRKLKYLPAFVSGLIAGFAFIWSNDYGICCWLCIIVMVVFIGASRNKKLLPVIIDALAAIIGSAISIFILIEIFSFGHFGNWLKLTFGTGGYQSWYYNSQKSYYLFDVDFSLDMMIQALFVIVYMIKLLIKKASKEAVIRYGIPAFVNMACFCAVNEYKLLSGGNSREVALLVLLVTAGFETVNSLKGIAVNSKIKSTFEVAAAVACLAWIVSSAKDEFIFSFITDKNGEYIESMGGYVSTYNKDLNDAHRFLNGEKFFATYSSAQEVYENKFQPTGTDYIIHVLGDEQREKYLNEFLNGDFKYAATIRKQFTDWAYWEERADWFLFRELYDKWHPVFSNSYETYWERNTHENENTLILDTDVHVEVVNDALIKLEINLDKSVNGIADVYVDYRIEKRPGSELALLQFQRMLNVQSKGTIHAGSGFFESNNLRPVSAEYIPMNIEKGHGELLLTSNPYTTTILKLNKASCEKIYTVNTFF